MIGNVLSRVLSDNLRNVHVDRGRRLYFTQLVVTFTDQGQRKFTISVGAGVGVTNVNLRLVIVSNHTNCDGHKGTLNVGRAAFKELHLLRVSRTARRFNRAHKFLKGAAKRVTRNIQVINNVNRDLNGRQSHTNQDFRLIKRINGGITPGHLRPALFKRIVSGSNMRIVTGVTGTRTRVRRIK